MSRPVNGEAAVKGGVSGLPFNWRDILETEHLVHFYENDTRLLTSLSDFVAIGLEENESVIVVATKGHRDALEQALIDRGFDLASLRTSGQYRTFDAAESLSKFMVDGQPNADLFADTFAPVLQQAKSNRSRLRVYGEMVALLWADGNHQAAIRLEELWNELHQKIAFSLLCAYPVQCFDQEIVRPIEDVCAAHSTIIPLQSAEVRHHGFDRLSAVVALQQKTKELEAEIERRKQIEEELRASKAELNDFFENAADGLHRVAQDGTISLANQAELDMLGYKRDEYVGHHISEFHADSAVIDSILARLHRNETLRNVQAELRRKDGTLRTVLINSNGSWKDGVFNSSRCITRDITDLKRSEQAHSFLAAIVESADDAIIGKTLEGIITSWNPGAQEVFGYSADEAIGRSVTMLIPAGQQDEERYILERIRKGERIENYETRRLKKDGTLIDVSLTISPIKNKDNEIVGASKIARDITERKQCQAALSSYKDNLERQVEDLKRLHEISLRLTKTIEMDGVFNEVLAAALDAQRTDLGLLSLFDPEHNCLVVKASRGFDQEFLSSVERVPIGDGACGLCYGSQERVIVEDVDQAPIFAAYIEPAHKAGFRSVHSMPLVTRKGKAIGVLSVHFRKRHKPTEREQWFMDLYARMAADFIENARLHQQIQQQLADREQLLLREQVARSSAENANRMKDEFLATASHELRTPLNAIIGWCHVLRNPQLDSKTLIRAVDTIDRNAKTQAQLIEDILDVSRVVAGKLLLNIAKVDLSAVINSAIDSIQPAATSKGIRLEVIADPLARQISGDAIRLQQVVWNLLSNAIKFTPCGGTVSVKLVRATPGTQITISDSGNGIDPEFLPHIFDRFTQGDPSSTRRQEGLGLGLAIVKHLVELHGGTVRADSPGKGRGATFTIQLPTVFTKDVSNGTNGGHPWQPKAIGNHQALQNVSGVRLLIVDDNQDTTSLLAEALVERKALVQTAHSVSEALDILKWYNPQVLVSDLAMPDEDGYSLISKVRQLDEGKSAPIPTIALTALVRVQDRARALSAGFNMFVPKPVEPAELVAAIAQLLERQRTSDLLETSTEA